MTGSLYWQEESEQAERFRVPDDVFDVVFSLSGEAVAIDHAQALANAVCARLNPLCYPHIGIHQIRVAESGNGWARPSDGHAILYLSRRTRLVIRVHSSVYQEVAKLSNTHLDILGQRISVGECKVRQLSTMSTIFSHAVACEAEQPETDFLADLSRHFGKMNVAVKKMICGTTKTIVTDAGNQFVRTLLLADLTPEDSIYLQQIGLGDSKLMGCGLFVAHKGIDAVYSMQK